MSTCATCDGFFFREKPIAVVGGGDSAIEEAIFLTKFATTVTLIHRRDELRASKIMQDRAFANPKIEFVWNSEVSDVMGDGSVEALRLRDTVTGAESDLEVNGLFVAIGHDPNTALFRGQLDLDENGYIVTDADSTRTSVEGVFAAGDVQDHVYRQAITAVGIGLHGRDRSRALARRARHTRLTRPPGNPTSTLGNGAATGALWPDPVGRLDRPQERTHPVADDILTLSDATFDETIAGADTPVLVDFWAEWCGPCKMIAPTLAEIASEQEGKLAIAKLNVDDNPDTARRFDVMSIPTLLVFKDGQQVKRLVGAKGKGQLLQDLAEFIA